MCSKTIEKTLFPSVAIICLTPEETTRYAAEMAVAAIAVFVRVFMIVYPAIS